MALAALFGTSIDLHRHAMWILSVVSAWSMTAFTLDTGLSPGTDKSFQTVLMRIWWPSRVARGVARPAIVGLLFAWVIGHKTGIRADDRIGEVVLG